MVKHSKYFGVHVGDFVVFFCTHEEIQFLVCTAAPINKCILIAQIFHSFASVILYMHPQLFHAAHLQAAAVSCGFPLWLSPGFIVSSFKIILQFSAWNTNAWRPVSKCVYAGKVDFSILCPGFCYTGVMKLIKCTNTSLFISAEWMNQANKLNGRS